MITVTFADGCLLATASKSLWQYDYGQQLEIVGLDLPEVFQVDFCNSGDTSTITVLGENNVVSIPDQFILDGRSITAFCFVYDETTGGTTRAEMKLPVLPRPQRTDEQPDPEQESVIDQLIAELNDGVEAAAESAEDSEAWAVGTRSGEPVSEDDPAYENSAKYWAEQAYTASPVTSVNGQIGDVELTLDDIPNGSTYARTTPAQVQQIETNKDDISSIEVLIPNQASAANQLADKGFVNSSIQTNSAHFRGNWANWAAVPTNPELYPADDDGVHTPTSNDYMVIQDASDYPVPAGETALEGTWRFKYSGVWATNGRNGWQKEYQVNETPLTAAQLAALNSGATAELIAQIGTNETAIGQLQANKQNKITATGMLKGDGSGGVSAAVAGADYLAPSALEPYRTAAAQDEIDAAQDERLGAVEQTTTATTIGPTAFATLEASSANMPLKALSVNVEPVQAGSGDPSPDNVRPISGHDSVSVTRTGKNLLDPSLLKDRSSWNTFKIVVAPNAWYTCSTNKPQNSLYLYFRNTNGDGGGSSYLVYNSHPVTVKSTAAGEVFISQRRASGTGSFADYQIMVEKGSTASAYESYQSNTYTIQLGDTVYGGTLDVTGGKMVVDMANIASYNGETLPGEWISDRDVYSTGGTPTIGAQVVYFLATPFEITLTPTQIDTLLGQNNIWSDAGNVTVTYGAYLETLKTYAEQLGDSILSAIAPLESTYTASRAYTVGSYLFVGTKFYKVTAAIGSGDTITPGTNATETTVAAQLMELAEY